MSAMGKYDRWNSARATVQAATSRHGQDWKVRGQEPQNTFLCVCVGGGVSRTVREVKDVSYIPGVFLQGEAACLDLARIKCLSLSVQSAEAHSCGGEAESCGGCVVLQMDSKDGGGGEMKYN